MFHSYGKDLEARSHDPVLRIQFLVPQIGSRRSDRPISLFHFCGENVGRSFVVCSHDPISRTERESSIWCQNDHRDIMQNLSAPFIFQEECRMKIEHFLFPSVSFKLTDSCVRRSFLRYSQDLIFETNKNRILENRSCEQAKPNFLDNFKNLNDDLKLWKCRGLTLANKVLIFKSFKTIKF